MFSFNIINIEGFCFIDLDYIRKQSEYDYKIIFKEDGEHDIEPVKNKDYDPDVKIPDPPEFCENKVCFTCLDKNCPFFGFAEYKGDEYD